MTLFKTDSPPARHEPRVFHTFSIHFAERSRQPIYHPGNFFSEDQIRTWGLAMMNTGFREKRINSILESANAQQLLLTHAVDFRTAILFMISFAYYSSFMDQHSPTSGLGT
jgi:hypothetical protein